MNSPDVPCTKDERQLMVACMDLSANASAPVATGDDDRDSRAQPLGAVRYFMESEVEAVRLDVKTDPLAVEDQARWAGVRPGMRILDLGCGAGRTSQILNRMVQPGGEVVGVDASPQRIAYAREHFGEEGVVYLQRDVRQSLKDLGGFDLVWIRFVLEYYAGQAFIIAQNAHEALKEGGTLFLADLDQNCLGHFGASRRLERTLRSIVLFMQEEHGFDPFVGRKLPSYLYDLACADIEVRLAAHHLIHGKLSDIDRFNWLAKAESARTAPSLFAEDYPGGYREFERELVAYLESPRRLIYTPFIMCKGSKAPAQG